MLKCLKGVNVRKMHFGEEPGRDFVYFKAGEIIKVKRRSETALLATGYFERVDTKSEQVTEEEPVIESNETEETNLEE